LGGVLDNFRAGDLLSKKITSFIHPLKDDIALKTKSRCSILYECGCFTFDTPDLAL
jgi:hypothetical protein